RAKVTIEQGSAGRHLLVITEVPYQVNKAAMLEKILKLSEEKKAALGCIYDIRDESDRTGMRAVVELRKEADPQKVLNYLYKYSDLQVTFGVNMVAIAEGKPVLMGLKTMLEHYLRHQKNVVTRRTQYDLERAQARAHILQGLMVAVDNLDEVIALIRGSKTPKEAKQKLMERFELSDAQAQAILDMRLQRLTNLEILALRKEYEDLLKLISKLEGILKSEKKLLNVIRTELDEIVGQFDSQRRTTLEKESSDPKAMLDETPVPEDAVVTFSFGGYLRRMYPKFYEKMVKPDPMTQLEECPQYVFSCQTDHTLYFFTDKGNCYPLPVGALPEMNKPKDRGQLLSGVLQGLEDGEKLLWLTCVKNGELPKEPDYLFITAQGMIKRTAAADYDVRRAKFVAVNIKEGDRLLMVLPVFSQEDLLLVSRQGMSIRFSLDSVPVMGRTTTGVKAMVLDGSDQVIWASQINDMDQLALFSERGYGKRVMGIDFDRQNRNGKGVKVFPFNKNGSNGTRVADCYLLSPDPGQTLTLYQAQSPATQLFADEVALQTKQDKGKPYVLALMEDVVVRIIGGGVVESQT
ncbi:MAG: hypothetical protein IJ461_02435, partial [Clostridia bacterium]|nr:hypothetical protein [Clostridia bacterium]